MLIKKLCNVAVIDGEPYQGLIVTEPVLNLNGHFVVVVANNRTGKLQTVMCDLITLVPDQQTMSNNAV